MQRIFLEILHCHIIIVRSSNLIISIPQEGTSVTLRIDGHPQQLAPVVYQLMSCVLTTVSLKPDLPRDLMRLETLKVIE